MRKEFESWVKSRAESSPSGFYPQLHHRCTLDPDRYVISWVDSAWEGWKASRADIEVQLPIPKELCGPDGSYMEYFEPEQVERCIESLGLKVKS